MLSVEHISKSFGGLQALIDVKMLIKRGSITGLIGPNGAGKTTLFNIIAGFQKPDHGSIIFNENDITGRKPYEICKLGLTRTFQTTKPFLENTVIENIMVGALLHDPDVKKAEKISWEIVEMLGLKKVATLFGHELTVPDRKRLEVARAIATGAVLLLLDEPMAGLNPAEKARTVELFRKINKKGISMIIVEHDMKSIMSLCSHIVILDRGAKLLEGSPAEVTKNDSAIAVYLGDDYEHIGN